MTFDRALAEIIDHTLRLNLVAPIRLGQAVFPSMMARGEGAIVNITSIVAEVGPEVVAGSTRMKAGTAQKMILNMLTTGAMTRLGYVYGNLMVNVHPNNEKLVDRAARILQEIAGIDHATALQSLHTAEMSVPVALEMLKTHLNLAQARRRLKAHNGNVRQAMEG